MLCCIQKLLRDSLITVEVGNVSGIQQQFLQCTKSNINNKNRGASDNPVVAWVKIKEKLRDAVARVFFPNTSNNILTEYSKEQMEDFARFQDSQNTRKAYLAEAAELGLLVDSGFEVQLMVTIEAQVMVGCLVIHQSLLHWALLLSFDLVGTRRRTGLA